MQVQTRNDEGELRHFDSLLEAFNHARNDLTVWKVSFEAGTGERIRLTRLTDDGSSEWIPSLFINGIPREV